MTDTAKSSWIRHRFPLLPALCVLCLLNYVHMHDMGLFCSRAIRLLWWWWWYDACSSPSRPFILIRTVNRSLSVCGRSNRSIKWHSGVHWVSHAVTPCCGGIARKLSPTLCVRASRAYFCSSSPRQVLTPPTLRTPPRPPTHSHGARGQGGSSISVATYAAPASAAGGGGGGGHPLPLPALPGAASLDAAAVPHDGARTRRPLREPHRDGACVVNVER
jgi:hypothetical protein